MAQTPKSTAALAFLLYTALSQVIAGAGAVIAWPIIDSIPLIVIVATTLSASCSFILGLPTPWKLVNTALPIAAAASLSIDVPGWIFLVPLCVLAAIYAPALWTRVPYYPTSRAAYALILAELPVDRPFTFIDIGCGFGDLLVFLSRHRRNGSFIGIEVGILPWIIGKLRALQAPHRNLSVHFKNMHTLALDEFDFVYTFLSPAAMDAIWMKVTNEMRPGSTFITNSFPVPATADEILTAKDARGSRLFIHRMRRESTSVRCAVATANYPHT